MSRLNGGLSGYEVNDYCAMGEDPGFSPPPISPTETEEVVIEALEPEVTNAEAVSETQSTDPEQVSERIADQVQVLLSREEEGGILNTKNTKEKGGLTREKVGEHVSAILAIPFPADPTDITRLPEPIYVALQLAHASILKQKENGGREMQHAPALLGAIRSKIDGFLQAENNPQVRARAVLTIIKMISASPSGIYLLRQKNTIDWSSFMTVADFSVAVALIVNKSKKGLNTSARARNMALLSANLDEQGFYELLVSCDDLAELDFDPQEIESFRRALALELVNSCLHALDGEAGEQCDFEASDEELNFSYSSDYIDRRESFLNSDYRGRSHDLTRNTSFLDQTEPLMLADVVIAQQFDSPELEQVLSAIRRIDGDLYDFVIDQLLRQSQDPSFRSAWAHHITNTQADFAPLFKRIVEAMNPKGIAGLNQDIEAIVRNFFTSGVSHAQPNTHVVAALPLSAASPESEEASPPPPSSPIVEVERRR